MAHPEGSPLPTLPTTFRPQRALWMLVGLAIAVTVSLVALALVLPSPGETTAGFKTDDRVGFVILTLIIDGGLAILGRPRVRADQHGLEVINVARKHRLAWAQVIAVRMRPGDAWMVLDLDDGTTLNAMGVQAADGLRGRQQAAQIAALVAAHSATPRDD